MPVIDKRRQPFAMVTIAALERIRQTLPKGRHAGARSAYLALVEGCTLRGDFKRERGDTLKQLSELAGISERRLRDYLAELKAIGEIGIESNTDHAGRDLESTYCLLDGPDESSDRPDRSQDDLSSDPSGPYAGASGCSEKKEEEREGGVIDARLRTLDPVESAFSAPEQQAIDGLAWLMSERGAVVSPQQRSAIALAARAADGVDPAAAVKKLERYYGPGGRGEKSAITDIVALFVAQLARSAATAPEPVSRFAFKPTAPQRRARLAAVAAPAAGPAVLPRDLEPPGSRLQASWQQMRDQLRASVNESTWGIWLDPVRLAGFTTSLVTELDDPGGERSLRTLYLTAPTEQLSWIETRFAVLLRSYAAETFGPDVELQIAADPATASQTSAA